MGRRVREHLDARGDPPRDLIAAAFVAAPFEREQTANGVAGVAQTSGKAVSRTP
jgi:hypothetical protein